mmetsp:Transcript_9489/g.33050  ORF Transcript_9489/g.33050 Transcript_9489/m.33050 type:complete len:228 (+) Transcript_9489:1898-2581(+)
MAPGFAPVSAASLATPPVKNQQCLRSFLSSAQESTLSAVRAHTHRSSCNPGVYTSFVGGVKVLFSFSAFSFSSFFFASVSKISTFEDTVLTGSALLHRRTSSTAPLRQLPTFKLSLAVNVTVLAFLTLSLVFASNRVVASPREYTSLLTDDLGSVSVALPDTHAATSWVNPHTELGWLFPVGLGTVSVIHMLRSGGTLVGLVAGNPCDGSAVVCFDSNAVAAASTSV